MPDVDETAADLRTGEYWGMRANPADEMRGFAITIGIGGSVILLDFLYPLKAFPWQVPVGLAMIWSAIYLLTNGTEDE